MFDEKGTRRGLEQRGPSEPTEQLGIFAAPTRAGSAARPGRFAGLAPPGRLDWGGPRRGVWLPAGRSRGASPSRGRADRSGRWLPPWVGATLAVGGLRGGRLPSAGGVHLAT